jgi:formylglycine-generating enzyme required for sulfatase activity
MTDAAKLLVALSDPAAPFAERLEAAEALATLGDPRALAVDRVAIAGGVLPAAPGYRAHEVEVASFALDRYPVTVAAYAEFIAAGGYEDESWWSADGWAWRVENEVRAPRFWGEEEWAAYLVPNHAVVGASFHEAEAYAAFRGARLPTEAEWEWACRGPDGRCYPWGDGWQEDACGQRGYGPRGTVPIGVFPRGASPFGVRDMVGCVWQWCADPAERPGYEDPHRITRGGGWNNLQWSIGCTCRNAYPEGARFSNLGFRLAGERA